MGSDFLVKVEDMALTYDIRNHLISFLISFFFFFGIFTSPDDLIRTPFGVVAHVTLLLKFKILTSLLTSRVSYFPAPLK